MKNRLSSIPTLLLSLALCGCAAEYAWRSAVPQEKRSVFVSTFRNESEVVELGAVASRQILRELQREGTFAVARAEEAALEVQGVVRSASDALGAYDRRSGLRVSAYDMTARVEITVIDCRTRKVLVDAKPYVARTTMTAGQDLTTARRDASGRLMDDLSRQVVDDLLNLKW